MTNEPKGLDEATEEQIEILDEPPNVHPEDVGLSTHEREFNERQRARDRVDNTHVLFDNKPVKETPNAIQPEEIPERFTIAALKGWVVAERLPPPEESSGGIYFPDEARAAPELALVLAVPNEPEVVNVACPVHKGDLILLPKYSGVIFSAGNKELVALKYAEIIATLVPKEPEPEEPENDKPVQES